MEKGVTTEGFFLLGESLESLKSLDSLESLGNGRILLDFSCFSTLRAPLIDKGVQAMLAIEEVVPSLVVPLATAERRRSGKA